MAECAVCLRGFTDPTTLPCGHSFCIECVQNLRVVHGTEPQCPTCRQPFDRSRQRVNTLMRDDGCAGVQAGSQADAVGEALRAYHHTFRDGYPSRGADCDEPLMTAEQCDAFNDLAAAVEYTADQALDETLISMGLNRLQRFDLSDYVRQHARWAASPAPGSRPPRRLPVCVQRRRLPSNFWEHVPSTLVNGREGSGGMQALINLVSTSTWEY